MWQVIVRTVQSGLQLGRDDQTFSPGWSGGYCLRIMCMVAESCVNIRTLSEVFQHQPFWRDCIDLGLDLIFEYEL
jgi:hypothetical protein